MKKILVLGAGQLARMLALASDPLNISILAFDVRTQICVHPLTGTIAHKSLSNALKWASIITTEFEHVPPQILTQCAATGNLFPNAESILIGGNRQLEKQLLTQLNVACAPYHLIASHDELQDAIQDLKLPLILKTTRDGYDGKGQWRLQHEDQSHALWKTLAQYSAQSERQSILAETCVPFSRELSIIGARTNQGNHHFYPLTENIHHHGMLRVSLAYDISFQLQQQAQQIFKTISNSLNYVGVLAIEFFEVKEKLWVNEIAPRVHNSGHWTQNGASISQFEAHLYAICDFPLPEITHHSYSAMINIIGHAHVPQTISQWGHCHWYHKTPKINRKLGHINVCASNINDLIFKMTQLKTELSAEAFSCLEAAIQRLKATSNEIQKTTAENDTKPYSY